MLRAFIASLILTQFVTQALWAEDESFSKHDAHWMLVPQVSIISPREMQFSDGSHKTDFGDNFLGAASFGVGMAKVFKTNDRWQWLGFIKASYSYKEGTYRTLYSTGNEEQEKLGLHWLPLHGGVQFQYLIEELPFIKPSFGMSGGVQWLYQMGPNGGSTHSYWVPFVSLSPNITFFEGQIRDWFGGFSFGMTYSQSVSPRHSLITWGFDLSVNIVL